MALAPGTLVHNRYRIEQKIGQGGMGAVYAATDITFGSTVALKQYDIQGVLTPQQVQLSHAAFQREAKILNKLRHDGLPRVSDYFSDSDGHLFLVMDFIPGEDLETVLQRRGAPCSLGEVLNWAAQLCDILNYLHGQQPPVLHRDIKPSNVKLTGNNKLMLLDFGLARDTLSTAQATKLSSISGYTPNYAPPEQIYRTGTDPRSDIYSLAAMLYRMLTNTLPPDAATERILRKKDPLRPIHEINPYINPYISLVIHQALALDINDRPQTVAIFWQQLRAAAAGTLPFEPRPQRRPQRRPQSQSRWLLQVVIALVLLFTCTTISVMGAWVAFNSSPAPPPHSNVADRNSNVGDGTGTIVEQTPTAMLPKRTNQPPVNNSPVGILHATSTIAAHEPELALESAPLPTETEPPPPPTVPPPPPPPPPPVVPVGNVANSLEDAIATYYMHIGRREYDIAFHMLSDEFKSGLTPTLSSYRSGWEESGPAQLVKIHRIVVHSDYEATSTFTLYYPKKDVYRKLEYEFQRDTTNGDERFDYWLFMRGNVLESQTSTAVPPPPPPPATSRPPAPPPAPPIAARPQSTADTGIVIAVHFLAVQESKFINATTLAAAPRGATVNVLFVDPEPSDERIWARVDYEGVQGWMSTRYLRLNRGLLNHIGACQTATVVGTSSLTIREETKRDSARLDEVPEGRQVNVLCVPTILEDDHEWAMVEYQGTEGWMATRYLEFHPDGE